MPVSHPTRLLAVPLGAALAATGLTLAAPAPALAASTSVVVSEVYGGGGNSGATYTNDFVELYNLGTAAVDLSGWQVQYASAGGTATAPVDLTGSVPAGASYLVQLGAGAGGTTPLPSPDVTGASNLSGTSGRVDLLHDGALVDRVGYGTANLSEGAPAPAASNTTSVARSGSCSDTDANATDFTAGAPTPQGTAAGGHACGAGGGTTPPPPAQEATIAQVQGAAHRSPLEGKAVTGLRGVVTALRSNGFYVSSTQPDTDPSTSEGLYVFTSSAPTEHVGDAVSLAGTVTEYRAGGATNLTTTELSRPTVTVTGTAPLPAPVLLGVDRVAPPQTVEPGDPGDVELAPFDPATGALDFYESLEGMRVAVRDARVVGPTNDFGEITVVPGRPAQTVTSRRGGVVYSGYDHPNTSRIQLDGALLAPDMPAANVGDTVTGTTTGVVDYSFSNYELLVTALPTVQDRHLRRETTQAAGRKELSVATFNVENLAPSDPATKFERLAGQIVRNLASPDVLALEEIQDDTGATDDGTVTSGVTVSKLVAAIAAAGGPRYDARWIDPTNDTDGGQPGGNIRQVLLFDPARGVSFVDRPGGDATTPVTVTSRRGKPQLSVSPGRIDPANPAWTSSRKPLAAQLRFRGKDVFVVANHFASKGGDQPLMGRYQQPERSSEVQRHAQATAVRAFVDDVLAVDRRARVVVLGDLNDFEFSQTADILVGSGRTALIDLPRTLPASERYTYVYEGNSQVLDHILVSQGLRKRLSYDVVHTNAEFADQDSDHDPQVVRLSVR
ncbi:lamin tail domain-containing protein [Angustibacter aerolatus]